jgi:hypothetical protein
MRIWMKSLAIGALFSAGSLLLLYGYGLVGMLLIKNRIKTADHGGIGWDPVAALTLRGFVLWLVVAFLLGFALNFKRNYTN